MRLAIASGGILLSLACAEGIIRALDRNALPSVRLFSENEQGLIVLRDNGAAAHRTPSGTVYRLRTGDHGLRLGAAQSSEPSGAWLAVGDSQVLGLNVPEENTFEAIAARNGLRITNAGVPGYGLEEALQRASSLIPQLRPKGVLVFVNQANDWEEIDRPASQRFRVRGGWLLQAQDSERWEGAFMASPLSRLHTAFYLSQFIHRAMRGAPPAASPAWLTQPRAQRAATQRMASKILEFSARHPAIVTVVCFLPVDFATGSARAQRSPFHAMLGSLRPWNESTLRDQLLQSLPQLPVIDLLPVLRNQPGAFLERDYHLSQLGHALVAETLVGTLGTRSAALR